MKIVNWVTISAKMIQVPQEAWVNPREAKATIESIMNGARREGRKVHYTRTLMVPPRPSRKVGGATV